MFHPGRGVSSALAFTSDPARLLIVLEGREAERAGSLDRARSNLARAVGKGCAPGTFENLRRGRLKRVDWLQARLEALLVKEITLEIARLQGELDKAQRAPDGPPGAEALARLAGAIARAQALIGASTTVIVEPAP